MRVLLLIILFCAGCATPVAKLAETRWPQAVIAMPKRDVQERFLTAFASAGASIDDSNDSLLQARFPDPNAAMSKALFGCGFCADPYIKANVVFSTIGESTQIVVQYWRMIPKANGSEERMDINNNNDFNQWQKMLWEIRDQVMRKMDQS